MQLGNISYTFNREEATDKVVSAEETRINSVKFEDDKSFSSVTVSFCHVRDAFPLLRLHIDVKGRIDNETLVSELDDLQVLTNLSGREVGHQIQEC